MPVYGESCLWNDAISKRMNCFKNGRQITEDDKYRPTPAPISKERKRAKIRNRYNQASHLTRETNGKVTFSQLDITNEGQEVSPFPAGDHKA